MIPFRENDTVKLLAPVSANVIGESRTVILPIGAHATVVLVHGEPTFPLAYEIESYLSEQDCYVLATVDVDGIISRWTRI